MPKIKDEVNLKELEKFGYRLGLDDGCHKAYIKDLEYNDYIAIYENKTILIDVEDFCGSNFEEFQNKLLYDKEKWNRGALMEKIEKENKEWEQAYQLEKDEQFELLQRYRTLKQELEMTKNKQLYTKNDIKLFKNDTKCRGSEQFMNENIDYKRECEVLALQLHLLREEYNTLKHELEMLKQYYEEQNEVNTKFISKSKIEELVKQLEQDDINITKKYTEGKGLKCYLSDIDRVRIRAYRTKTREIKERIQKILEGE